MNAGPQASGADPATNAGRVTENSGFITGLLGIPDIGGTIGMLGGIRESLRTGKPLTEGNPALYQQAREFLIGQVGQSDAAIQQFMAANRDTVLGYLKDKPETIVNFIAGMDEAAFKELWEANKEKLTEVIENSPDLKETIQNVVAERLPQMNIGDLLAEANTGLTPDQIAALPESLRNSTVADLKAEDLQGLEPAQMRNLIGIMPVDQFNESILGAFNKVLKKEDGENYQVGAVSETASMADKLAAFDTLLERIQNEEMRTEGGALALQKLSKDPEFDVDSLGTASVVFNALTAGRDVDEDLIYSVIQGQITRPATLETFKKSFSDFDISELEIDVDKIDPAQLHAALQGDSGKALRERLADSLRKEENFTLVSQLMTPEFLAKNKDDVLNAFIPQALGQVQGFIDNLPPQMREMIAGFLDMALGFANNLASRFGIDIGASGASPSQASPGADPNATAQQTAVAPDAVVAAAPPPTPGL